MLANTSANWWETSFQYNAYLVIVLACAAVDGAARLDRWVTAVRQRRAGADSPPAVPAADGTVPVPAADGAAPPRAGRPPARRGAGTVALICAAAMCAVAVFLVPRFAFGPALHSSFYHRNGEMRAIAAADAVVPSGVIVAAVNNAGSQLSGRDTVVLWDGDGGTPPLLAPWVVANIRNQQFTFHNVGEQKQRVAFLERHGYQVVFLRHGYVVLHRAGSPGASAQLQGGAG
jgi:hypothetical protein